MPRISFADTRYGRDRLAPGMLKRRHRHARGYVAVVLIGSSVEAGDEGRRRDQFAGSGRFTTVAPRRPTTSR
jgi:hypothetical protein